MKKLEITINGTSYPCKMTLGAMLRFKELTGKEVSEISQTEVSAMATLLYCCGFSRAEKAKLRFMRRIGRELRGQES